MVVVFHSCKWLCHLAISSCLDDSVVIIEHTTSTLVTQQKEEPSLTLYFPICVLGFLYIKYSRFFWISVLYLSMWIEVKTESQGYKNDQLITPHYSNYLRKSSQGSQRCVFMFPRLKKNIKFNVTSGFKVALGFGWSMFESVLLMWGMEDTGPFKRGLCFPRFQLRIEAEPWGTHLLVYKMEILGVCENLSA